MSLNRTGRISGCGYWAMVLVAALSGSPAAHAAMQIDRTRVVLNEADTSATLHLHSEDRRPLLVQAWIEEVKNTADEASQGAAPALTSADFPFFIDPPVVYLQPEKSHVLRILRVSAPGTLPAGRESLYWVNVREIPATVSAAENQLHISVQSRLKLFYRPQALARYGADGYQQALASADRLRFVLERDDTGQTWLAIHNPAPIHQTLATLALHRLDAAPITLDPPMLAPFETQRLVLPQTFSVNTPSTARLAFATVNDDGNLIEDEQAL